MTRDSLKPTASERRRGSGPWGPERRLEFIDFRLQWDGRLNRSDLMEHFGISVPQASADIAAYAELAPDNLVYDRSARVYVASSGFAGDAGTISVEARPGEIRFVEQTVMRPFIGPARSFFRLVDPNYGRHAVLRHELVGSR